MDVDEGGSAFGAPPWSPPEVAVVAVLGAVAVLALGGLAMGIDVAASTMSPYPDSLIGAWDSVTYGASWAGPVLAMALLAGAGVCWWQADRWADDAGGDTDDDAAQAARRYVARAQRLAVWNVAGMTVVTLAAFALCAAVVGIDVASHAPQQAWARVIGVAADAAAVVVVQACGIAVVRGTQRIGQSLR